MTIVENIDILNAIEVLKLEGSLVCIHASLKSFGYVDGGAAAIIRSFLDKGCTILTPGFTYDYSITPSKDDRPQRNAWDYDKFLGDTSGCDKIFSVNNNDISIEDLGVIPYEILQMPERKRGYNPIDSFTSLGSKAVELISEQSASDVWAPLRKLYTEGGFVVLMGVSLTSMTAIHYAEQKAGRIPFIRWANGLDGLPIQVSIGSCSNGFDKLAPVLKPIEKDIYVGNSLWRVFPMKEAIDLCVAAIKKNPMITHCDNPDCERCNDAVQGGPILMANF